MPKIGAGSAMGLSQVDIVSRETGSYRLVGTMTPEEETEYRVLVGRLSYDELAILRCLEIADLLRRRSYLHNTLGHRAGVGARISNDSVVRRFVRRREIIDDRRELLLRERRAKRR